jgi:hypothetical protein
MTACVDQLVGMGGCVGGLNYWIQWLVANGWLPFDPKVEILDPMVLFIFQ